MATIARQGTRRLPFIYTPSSQAESDYLVEILRIYGCRVVNDGNSAPSIYASPKSVAEALVEGWRAHLDYSRKS